MEEYPQGDEERGQGQAMSYESQVEEIHGRLEGKKRHGLDYLLMTNHVVRQY